MPDRFLVTLAATLGAALLAWVGARWSRTLPHYVEQRRAVPRRTVTTVALAAAAAGVAAWQSASAISAALLASWSVVFALVAVVDIETHFIPNRLIVPATVAALLASGVDPRLSWRAATAGALAGFAIFGLLVLVARGGFGGGDAMLAAFVGAVTGMMPVFYALIVGVVAGGLGAALLIATRRLQLRAFMPYGPFLCFGGWLGMLPAVLRFWGVYGWLI